MSDDLSIPNPDYRGNRAGRYGAGPSRIRQGMDPDTRRLMMFAGGLGGVLVVLIGEAELVLMRRLALWPRTVEAAAIAREPHRIAFFLYDLAADFHMLWNRGKDDTTLRFLQLDQPAETRARLALVAATAVVIRSGLAVMGVTPVEEMR